MDTYEGIKACLKLKKQKERDREARLRWIVEEILEDGEESYSPAYIARMREHIDAYKAKHQKKKGNS
jgi:hypothetical protein